MHDSDKETRPTVLAAQLQAAARQLTALAARLSPSENLDSPLWEQAWTEGWLAYLRRQPR